MAVRVVMKLQESIRLKNCLEFSDNIKNLSGVEWASLSSSDISPDYLKVFSIRYIAFLNPDNFDNFLKAFCLFLIAWNIVGVIFQSSSGSSGSSIRGDQLTRDQLSRDQLTKLNLGFPNDRSVANDQQQPNEQLHLRVMELSARLLLSSFVVIIFSNIMIIRLGEVTLERDQLAREKEKGREGRWESQCQRWNILSFILV